MGDDSTVGLKILIEGDAASAVAASGQAKDALEQVREQIRAAKDDTDAYQAALARMSKENPQGSVEDQAKAARVNDFIQAQRNAGTVIADTAKISSRAIGEEIEGTTKLTFGKHELRSAFRLLGHEMGAFGQMAHFLFSPTSMLLGGVLLLARFMKYAHDATAALTDKIREMRVEAAGIEAMENPVAKVDGQAIADAAVNTRKLADATKDAATFSDQLKTALGGELAILNAKAKAEADELKAMEENEITVSRAKAAASGTSPELQKIKEEQIRARYQNLGEGNSAFAEHQRIGLLQKEYDNLGKDQPALKDWAARATGNVAQLATGRSAADAKSNLTSEQATIADLSGKRDAEKEGSDKWRDLDNQIHERQKGVNGLAKEITDRTVIEMTVNADYAQAMKELTENTKRRADLEKQIATGHDVEDIKNNSMLKVQGMRRDTAGGVDIQAKETAQALREAAVSTRILGDEMKLAAVALRIEADKASGNVKDLNAALAWKAKLEADVKALQGIIKNMR